MGLNLTSTACFLSDYFSQHLGEYLNVLSSLESLNIAILKAMDKTKEVSLWFVILRRNTIEKSHQRGGCRVKTALMNKSSSQVQIVGRSGREGGKRQGSSEQVEWEPGGGMRSTVGCEPYPWLRRRGSGKRDENEDPTLGELMIWLWASELRSWQNNLTPAPVNHDTHAGETPSPTAQ